MVTAPGDHVVAAFTDLLAHHLGAAVADGELGGSDRFVTPPLWGLASRGPFLHDGRAATIQEAILAHGGEAEPTRSRYLALGSGETDLLLFLHTLSRPPVLSWVH